MNTLKILLKPYWANNTVMSMKIVASVNAESVQFDGPALDYANSAFEGLCPFPDYDQLIIEDDLGEVVYDIKEAPTEYNAASYLGLYFKRPIEGILKWQYNIYPRILPEGYESSPYYDFRSEPFGLNGSAFFSFILPKSTDTFKVELNWDLSKMPNSARGIWSYGEGQVVEELNTLEIRFSLFNVGIMNSVEKGEFGVFWFGKPNFEVKSVANKLHDIFLFMKDYFDDDNPNYRVFLRRDPFIKSGGGSACPHAFISGYSTFGGNDSEKWYNVLVHEMTHTWPYMDDTITGTGTWYTEGCTEYYCTVLPYRAGIVDAQYTLDRINEKAKDRYYDNVYREISNMEIPKIQWKDRRAQTVPYGRGFVYLSNVAAQLKRLGKGSIDDIAIQHTMSNKNPMTSQIWEKFILERLGEKGVQEFEDMKAGKFLKPDQDIFGPEFKTVKEEIELEGKKVVTYRWELSEKLSTLESK